jgi:ABC-type multidrug transport system ATPase subunit
MQNTECVEFISVRKSFGRPGRAVTAISNVSFSLERGRCLSLLGSNGSGKSTVLRIAGGLVAPDAGQFRVFGGNPCSDGQIRSRLAALFEGGRALYGRLTPEENAHYFSCLKGRDQRAAMARFHLLCERFAIQRFRNVAVQTLSRGTQQKVAAICALAGNEELWLLDEPTLGLDKESCVVLVDLIGEHMRTNGAVLVATHDEVFASQIGTVVRMADFGPASRGTWSLEAESCWNEQLVAKESFDQLRTKPGQARPGRRKVFCCW